MSPAFLRSRVVVAVIACLGLLLTGAVSASPAGASTTLTVAQLEASLGNAMYVLLNAERALHGLPPAHGSPTLVKSAHAHNLMMAKDNLMSHQCPGEASPGTRIWNAGYHWHRWGENVGWTTNETVSGIQYMERVMYNEAPPNDGHRLNILGNFYAVGIDVYIDAVHHKLWYTQDFAT